MNFPTTQLRSRRRPLRRGFTLVEAAFVTMIAGFVTVGTLQLMAVGTFANKESAELTTATNLAENIHEYTMTMGFDAVVAKNNVSYSPPIDSSGNACTELTTAWRQSISVKYVNPADINTEVLMPTKTARVTVSVYRNNNKIDSLMWLVTNPN